MRAITLFLHSTGTNHALWARVPSEITAGTERRHPAHLGYAPNPPLARGQRVTLADEVAHLKAAIGDDPRPLHVVGHSYGATVALALAETMNVQSLFLAEPVLFGALARSSREPEAAAESRSFLDDPTFLHDDAAGGDERWLTTFIDYWNRPGAFETMPAPLRAFQIAHGWKMYQEVRSVFFDVPEFPVIHPDIQLTLAVGERTTTAAAAMTREMARANPHARVVVMPGTGHMAPVTHPRSLLPAMRGHFGQGADPGADLKTS
jgi:pimeloyl-ACP methyl ester carboxylesterase